MQIEKIQIDNIKGIQHLEIKKPILPNRPNILVAPNGFGKSSLAIAFKSLESNGVILSKENRYLNREENLPSLTLSLSTGATLSATYNSNTISPVFSHYVVNSQIKATAKPQRIGGRINPNASLIIETTDVLDHIPARQDFEYNYSHLKANFGNNRKILVKIPEVFENPEKLYAIEKCVDFHAFDLVPYRNAITHALELINAIGGNADHIKEQMLAQGIINLTPEFNRVRDKISRLFGYSAVDAFIAAWQYIEVHKAMMARFKRALTYLNYLSKKQSLDETIREINPVADRFNIHSVESRGKLVIEWPKATQISNGQRDLMTFVARLMACEFSESYACILIIDEIFDYLDDANLITFQYYISTLIDKFKKSKRIIYPILLTHLDPNYLKHFCFNDTKLNVCYLQETRGKIGSEMTKLVLIREAADEIKKVLDKNYFHFNPNIDGLCFSDIFQRYGLNQAWANPTSFFKKVNRQNRAFHLEDDKPYDPIMVCLATRVQIESIVYNMLGVVKDKAEFINTHGTKEKLLFAQSKGVIIPETYFLLGIIYNHPLHEINGSTSQALSIKLENLSIKKMLRNLWD